ncbi:hypothetical protein D3C81_2273020 [compost metagenome]
MQGQADHFLRGIGDGDPAVGQLAGVFGLEQQVEAVQRNAGQTLLHRLDIDAQPQGAPGVGHAVLVARVDLGKFVQ